MTKRWLKVIEIENSPLVCKQANFHLSATSHRADRTPLILLAFVATAAGVLLKTIRLLDKQLKGKKMGEISPRL